MFEDALEEVEEAKEDVCINNNNINNSGSKSKIKFKLPTTIYMSDDTAEVKIAIWNDEQ